MDPWPHGTPSWVCLRTPDPATAETFYAEVLGWRYRQVLPPMESYPVRDRPKGVDVAPGHRIATIRSRPVAGIRRTPGTAVWVTYLATDLAEKVCQAARESAGTVLEPPGELGGEGRTALLADPTGAVFGLWQLRESIGASVVNEPGALAWNECVTADPAGARGFYTAILDLRYAPLDGPSDCTLIVRRGELWGVPAYPGHGPHGGIGVIRAIEPGSDPAGSRWETHFGVLDVRQAADDVRRAGGRVLEPPTRGRHGWLVTCSDPTGARFRLTELEPLT